MDRAGLKIVERYSHSRSVPYVPPGRDATVNWGGPDFTFKNNYNQPILIRAQVLPGRVFVTYFVSPMSLTISRGMFRVHLIICQKKYKREPMYVACSINEKLRSNVIVGVRGFLFA